MKSKEPPPHKCEQCPWRRVLSYKPENERLCQDCYDATDGRIRFNPQYCQEEFVETEVEKKKSWNKAIWYWLCNHLGF
jgi:hypothetical protein